jgi:hypothetical protein
MNKHPYPTWHTLWPWLLIIAVLALGSLFGSCAPAAPTATPTPTKTPRPAGATATPTLLPTGQPPTALVSTRLNTSVAATQPPAPTSTIAATRPAATATASVASPTPEPAKPTATAVPPSPTARPTVARPRPSGAMTSPDYGVQAFLWWREEVADRDLGLIRDAGFRWVKQLFSWQDIEGAGKGQFDWSYTDRIVNQVEKYGLKLIVRISQDPNTPFWAGVPPENAGDFAEFAAAVANRYRGRIQAYQVWNEPNLAREWGGKRPDPSGYAYLLRKAYEAIKAMDPNAIVITAGMAPTGTDSEIAMPDIRFYDLMYQAMGGSSKGYFDMLGVHGAGYAAPPELSPDEAAADKPRYGGERFFAFRHVEDVRAIMERNGDSAKRMAVLEFGWTTDDRPDSPYSWHGAGAGITEQLKGEYLVRAYQYAAEHWPWVGLMIVIYMPDANWTRNDEQYYWSIIGPGYPDRYWREAYMLLCIYINGLTGQRCPHAPNP